MKAPEVGCSPRAALVRQRIHVLRQLGCFGIPPFSFFYVKRGTRILMSTLCCSPVAWRSVHNRCFRCNFHLKKTDIISCAHLPAVRSPPSGRCMMGWSFWGPVHRHRARVSCQTAGPESNACVRGMDRHTHVIAMSEPPPPPGAVLLESTSCRVLAGFFWP